MKCLSSVSRVLLSDDDVRMKFERECFSKMMHIYSCEGWSLLLMTIRRMTACYSRVPIESVYYVEID